MPFAASLRARMTMGSNPKPPSQGGPNRKVTIMANTQALDTFLAKTNFPEPALAPVKEKVSAYVEMVTTSNEKVASLNASRTDTANNAEFVDSRWRANENDPAIAETVARFDEVAELYEKLQKQLRDHAIANYMPEVLDADAQAKARKAVNDMAPTIEQARKGLVEMLSMPEAMLSSLGVEFPKDGLISLLPTAESIKGGKKGRKGATGTTSYLTRVKDVLIEDVSTQVNGKGKIDYAAAKLSERFNAKAIPDNRVTAEDVEEAYFASLPGSPAPRSLGSGELPIEHTFTFTKDVKVQNGNDDSFKVIPESVKLTVRSPNFGADKETPKTETATTETPKTETEEPAKVEAKPETNSAPAAKKTAAPKK